jgi:hypothetical protein
MVAASIVLLVCAMRAYPGGSHWNATAGGPFWENYLCDLARTVALNGAPNPVGSLFARSSLTLLALALLPFWWLAPTLFPSRGRLGNAVRAFGAFSVTGALVVAIFPGDQFGRAHDLAIDLAGTAGILSASLAVVGLAWEQPLPHAATSVGAAALLSSVAAFGLYARQAIVEGPGPVASAVLERVAHLTLMAWMCLVAWQATRAAGAREALARSPARE